MFFMMFLSLNFFLSTLYIFTIDIAFVLLLYFVQSLNMMQANEIYTIYIALFAIFVLSCMKSHRCLHVRGVKVVQNSFNKW
jgi:hypothetical protein